MFRHTLKEVRTMREDALKTLIEFAGGKTHLAKMLGVSSPTINGWSSRGLISKKGAELTSQHPTLKGFTKSFLRPDVWGPDDEE